MIPLALVGQLVPVARPATLSRRHGRPVLRFEIAGAESLADLWVALTELELDHGESLSPAGGLADWRSIRSEMRRAIVLAVLLVLLVPLVWKRKHNSSANNAIQLTLKACGLSRN